MRGLSPSPPRPPLVHHDAHRVVCRRSAHAIPVTPVPPIHHAQDARGHGVPRQGAALGAPPKAPGRALARGHVAAGRGGIKSVGGLCLRRVQGQVTQQGAHCVPGGVQGQPRQLPPFISNVKGVCKIPRGRGMGGEGGGAAGECGGGVGLLALGKQRGGRTWSQRWRGRF